MKQFVLWMAIVGLATTGCAQNRVLGPHARRGGSGISNFQAARSRSMPRKNFRAETRRLQVARNEASVRPNESNVELAMFGGRRRGGNTCDGENIVDDCSGDGGCSSGGGCSSCGGSGCGLCQRIVGRVANGFGPHSGGYPEAYNYNPSPPTGQVTYPYYTVRGPRDFLRNNPPSIGPY